MITFAYAIVMYVLAVLFFKAPEKFVEYIDPTVFSAITTNRYFKIAFLLSAPLSVPLVGIYSAIKRN